MNKKTLCAFLTALLAITAVSCGNSDESAEKSENSVTEAETSPETEIQTETETSEPEKEAETSEPETETETSEPENSGENAYGTTADITKYTTDSEVTPPLWKVTDPETNNELYIMGTIHVLPSNFTEFPDYIMNIYENSDGIAVEYDTSKLTNDIRVLYAFQNMLLYDDGTTIKDHISDETYQKAKSYFEGIDAYTDQLDLFSAGFWYNQLSNVMVLRLENLNTDGVDATFIENANNDGKEVVNIETLDIQANAINGYSDELVDYLISEAIDEMDKIDDYAESLGELYNSWAKGDVETMLEEDLEEVDELPDELKDDYDDYMDIMLYNRNKGMADKASEFLKEGKNYFFMVGSAHYAGDKGVDDLLEEMGYKVEKIE